MVALFPPWRTSIFFPYSILDITASGMILDYEIKYQTIVHK